MKNFPSKEELEEVRNNLDKGIASRPLPKNASHIDRIKYRLCEKFVIYKNSKKLTQRELAKLVDVDEAIMSKILHYHFSEFTTDRLIKYLAQIYDEIDFNVNVA
ncbi:MAG: hypothetical protein A2504_10490 [Bdellovibrionales bacterium RIFOXYD12_FULL_39_22]|nr:MAG: hypothetical protein A2385_17105 [Bdellovibrionales bacterium RIFOXYB1_FULL_39_21]OFZ44092.1 MAG: hypothetical protein A2485_14135 [Bdellovibrionales bacterium RIFOXYC12_FULL_39_17]OFZ48674.1 MAG: hypothetical protein A2404_08310 [Bdellovibrionales bacterium RIFOXYC1_FULL_39_130]OFZ74322.1 MAG: hypothetical protein A2451_15665 [Bdellovibrionales bacterium RIFOXYC2_FULL_39_8]OFZ76788.1 MAG: hypothetical protein A2560_10600 [Bdellovibrionales bacterium RIFOXYD1_FULL_39_84]OFZ95091.1 MAG: